jgi:hypothetical protein
MIIADWTKPVPLGGILYATFNAGQIKLFTRKEDVVGNVVYLNGAALQSFLEYVRDLQKTIAALAEGES